MHKQFTGRSGFQVEHQPDQVKQYANHHDHDQVEVIDAHNIEWLRNDYFELFFTKLLFYLYNVK